MSMTATPLGELVVARREVWEQSVDELDASVSLEADGVNDAVAANRFGVPDVAALAEQLVALVPARAQSVSRGEGGTTIPSLRLALRGLIFAVPGLFYLTVAFTNPTSTASITMVIALLTGWGLSQAVALVAYRVLGRHGGPSAALVQRRIITGSLAAAGVALMLAAAVGGDLVLVALATGQVLYIIAATVLLFHAADRLLGLVLAPGALVCAAYLGKLPVPDDIALSAVAVTVLAACGAAWYRADTEVPVQRPAGRAALSDLRASGPFVLQGVLSGIVVAYIPVRMLGSNVGADAHPLDLSIVPLVLSMGFAEIELLRLRAAGGRLMRRTVSLAGYRRGAFRLMASSQLRFLLVLVSVSVVVGVLIDVVSGFNTRDLTLLGAYSILGTALLAALVLVAVDRVYMALAGFLLTGCAVAVGAGVVWTVGMAVSVEGGYLAICVALLVCLTSMAFLTLRDPRVLA
jgi:hypothetical protein